RGPDPLGPRLSARRLRGRAEPRQHPRRPVRRRRRHGPQPARGERRARDWRLTEAAEPAACSSRHAGLVLSITSLADPKEFGMSIIAVFAALALLQDPVQAADAQQPPPVAL